MGFRGLFSAGAGYVHYRIFFPFDFGDAIPQSIFDFMAAAFERFLAAEWKVTNYL